MPKLLPASYFGSIAYFQELAKHSHVIIEAKEHFPKQTYRNRCDIVSADGILSLSIPTKKSKGSKTPTDAVVLSNEENWRIRHWRAITSAYQSAAYFDHYNSEVKELLLNEEKNYLQFTLAITQRVIDWLELGTTLSLSEEFEPIAKNDARIELVGKNAFQEIEVAPYIQVFPGKSNFRKSISILDAIFCEGPLARKLIMDD